MNEWKYFELMLQLAVEHHKGQERWDGTPYLLHLLRVAYQCRNNAIEATVGIGYDILEDTDMTAAELQDFDFPNEVVDAIVALTKLETEPYKDYILRVKQNELATKIKLRDLKDNLNILSDPDFDNPDRYRGNCNRLKRYWRAVQTLTSQDNNE